MKRALILFCILFTTILMGCTDKNPEEVMELNDIVNEQMGVEILIPEYKNLDVYVAYVSFYEDGEPKQANIQYSKNKGSLNEEYAREIEELSNLKVLCGPYEVDYDDVSINFIFEKKYKSLDNISGERIHVGDIEVIIQDIVDSNNFQHHHFKVGNHYYGISYQLNHFSEGKAFEKTKTFIEDLNKQSK